MPGLVLSFTTMYRPSIYRLNVDFCAFLTPDVDTAICALDARKVSPITGLDRPRGFQEFKVPRFRDNATGW